MFVTCAGRPRLATKKRPGVDILDSLLSGTVDEPLAIGQRIRGADVSAVVKMYAMACITLRSLPPPQSAFSDSPVTSTASTTGRRAWWPT